MSDQAALSLPIEALLQATFGRDKDKAALPQATPHPEPKPEARQVIANVYAGASAQRFFDPSFHAVEQPSIKQPSAGTLERGTSNQMSMESGWGTPPEKEK